LIAKPQESTSIVTAPSDDGPQAVAAVRTEPQASNPPVSNPPVKVSGNAFAVEKASAKQELKQAFKFQPKQDWAEMDERERAAAIDEKRKAYEKYKAFLASRKQQGLEERRGDKGDAKRQLEK